MTNTEEYFQLTQRQYIRLSKYLEDSRVKPGSKVALVITIAPLYQCTHDIYLFDGTALDLRDFREGVHPELTIISSSVQKTQRTKSQIEKIIGDKLK